MFRQQWRRLLTGAQKMSLYDDMNTIQEGNSILFFFFFFANYGADSDRDLRASRSRTLAQIFPNFRSVYNGHTIWAKDTGAYLIHCVQNSLWPASTWAESAVICPLTTSGTSPGHLHLQGFLLFFFSPCLLGCTLPPPCLSSIPYCTLSSQRIKAA